MSGRLCHSKIVLEIFFYILVSCVGERPFFSELCWGKIMVAYTKPQQRKKEESESLRGERDQLKFIDLRLERLQVVRFRKARRRQCVQ